MKKRKKVGVALSGGSALGIAHIGALRSLRDHDIPIDCISGTSAGAVAAACYAFDVSEEKIIEEINNLSWRAISSFSFSKLGFVSNDKLGEILAGVIGHRRIEDARIPLAIVATNISTGRKVVFRKGDVIEAVLASSAIPGVFMPVIINDQMFVDGGLVQNLPLPELDHMGADVKIGINVTRKLQHSEPKNLLDIYYKAENIIFMHQYKEPAANEVLIEPNLADYSGTDFSKADQLIAEGHHATTLKLEAIRRLIGKKEGVFEQILSYFGI